MAGGELAFVWEQQASSRIADEAFHLVQLVGLS